MFKLMFKGLKVQWFKGRFCVEEEIEIKVGKKVDVSL